jgi:AcrR family transcriptional regulator
MGTDRDTRQRLLDTAARLFAQRGFNNVTVRDLCVEAKANVASVNYHFRNKYGLYVAVVGLVIDAMRRINDDARRVGEGHAAEQKLRLYIRVFLERLQAIGRDSWIHQLIRHEFSDPTGALDLLIEKGLRPRFEYLSGLVGELLGCPADDPRVLKCVISIQAQFLTLVPSPAFTRVYEKFRRAPPALDELAEHIAEFSLAGIRALGSHRAGGYRHVHLARRDAAPSLRKATVRITRRKQP